MIPPRSRIRWLPILSGFTLAISAWPIGGGEAAPLSDTIRGRLVVTSMSAPSLHQPTRGVRVYLPAGYDRPEMSNHRYPVVFLLHGWTGGDRDWQVKGLAAVTLDSMIASGRIPPLIAVMPDANGKGLLGRSLYVNSYDGTSRVEDFIVRDVVAWVDSAFRTRPEVRYRALVGLSEGGDAAVNLTFKHPDVFGACGSHSGAFRLRRGIGEGRVLGPDSTASRILLENSPLMYAESVASSLADHSIYLDCGTSDGRLEGNREFHRRLAELGIPHVYPEFPGKHRWGYWKAHLHDSLLAVTSRMW